jgi:TAT-translocated FGD2 family F420-dependent dehydrogenase
MNQQISAQGRQVTIGLALPHEQFPVPHLVELGVQAEQAGFHAIWASDHFQPWQENQGHSGLAWVTLAALGQRTRSILLGTGVTCPTYRYRPQIVAEAFASLGLLYPGRVFLGVGSGEALNEVPGGGGWGPYRERAARLEEAVSLIRTLWTGEWVKFQGRFYLADMARLYDVPKPPVPIYVAAGGPRSMTLAGKIGDGLISDAQRATQPELRRAFEQGAQEAGKDSASLPVLAEHLVVVGTKQDAERAAQRWRFMPKAWERYVSDPDPRSIQRRAERDIPLEDVYRSWVVSEDPEAHVQALHKLIDGGVTHIFLHSPQADQASVIAFYGEQVLPKLSQAPLAGSRR